MSPSRPPAPLEPFQEEQAAAHAPLEAVVVHEIIRTQGEAELVKPTQALLWSGLAAGLSIGLSFAVQAMMHAALPETAWRHMAASLGYTVGFIVVVMGRQQLFTESTLSAVLPVLTRRDGRTLMATLRLWSLVLAANLVGTWLFAAVLAFGRPLGAEVEPSLATVAAHAVAEPFGPTFLKAMFAGWLIALIAWLAPTAGSAKILVIALLTWAVAFGRFNHIVAGSTEAAYAVLLGQAGGADYLWRFALPTLLGNTLGGVFLVAMLNHAPVAHQVR